MNPEIKNLNIEPMGVGLPPEMASHEQKKEELVGALHKDGPLPNLRTYHGDIAEFIKSKDQSLSDIVLKQNEKKREEKEKAKDEVRSGAQNKNRDENRDKINTATGIYTDAPSRQFSDLPTNFLIYVISISLMVGAVAAAAYLFVFNDRQSSIKIVDEHAIIASKNKVVIDLSAITRDGLKETLNSLRNSTEYMDGITAISVSDSSKKTIITAGTLIDGLKFNMPSALRRALGEEFVLGLYGKNTLPDFFLILKVKDYGIAYRDMLEWEGDLVDDFGPLLTARDSATSTVYAFKDLIVKNKDTRAAVSNTGQGRLIYTFLNKETILITESEGSIKDILDAFVAGNMVR